ncbi:MAG TPA: zeta toxin family protein [Stellaceae bacterium]|nr:zeta toxin family protein [Stellaceae bacterium]
MVSGEAPKRPFILVLAGVNGAGKSSVGGGILVTHGLTWFNPDAFSRELMARSGLRKEEAEGAAWAYGKATLEAAMANRTNFAFETTLGANTIPRLLGEASETHDVIMIFCGLASVQMHIDRVKIRVGHGGHDIPEEKIRKRWESSRQNLIKLLPRLAHLQVFDNSKEAALGEDVPPPVLVLEMKTGRLIYPGHDDAEALKATPEWAKPIVAAAFRRAEAERE